MLRNADLTEISDGRLYGADDLVRTDTGGCKNCGLCCHGMKDTIVLDPYDLYQLQREKHMDFSRLMDGCIELGLCDGLILPHLRMQGEDEACVFLNAEGRCSIHTCRPGFCRLYPLGRYYHDRDFSYIFQTDECVKKNLSKIRVRKWLGIPDLPKYEAYIRRWHYCLRDMAGRIDEEQVQEMQQNPEAPESRQRRTQICLQILRIFFETPYDETRDFYPQFEERFAAMDYSAQITG